MNYIGRMYRPIEVFSLNDKRGLGFRHKYKSNFGPKYDFTQDILLHLEEDRETIYVHLKKLPVSVLLDASYFEKVDNQTAISKGEKRKVNSPRKIHRPGNKKLSSKEDYLFGEMIIESDHGAEEKMTFEIKPVLIAKEEYLQFHFSSETQIKVTVDTSLEFIKR